MRKNARDVLAMWSRGEPWHKADSFWTDGADLYSYRTCLYSPDRAGAGPALFNITKYSSTTSSYQGAIRQYLGLPWGEYPAGRVVPLDGMPRGVTARDLLGAAVARTVAP